MKKKLMFLVYLTQTVYPKYNPFCFVIYMIIKYLNVIKQRQIYNLQIVGTKRMKQLLGDELIWDINNTIIVNDTVKGNCIKFLVGINKNDEEITKRKVNVITKPFDDGFIALTNETLDHNLNGVVSCSFRSCSETLKFADEVELSLINTSNDWSNAIVDTCVKSYFQLPKLLHKNDVIAIDLGDYGQTVFFSTNRIVNIKENIYFKCNKITSGGCEVSGGYLCSIGKTSVSQTQNVQSFIPKTHENSLPSAFQTYIDNLQKALYPFLSNKSKHDFSPIFLLEGRRGSGKSLLTQQVASRLGMHLYTVSNYDVCANVYAQNETKLRNIIFTAKLASPTILEIKNFENFGKNMDGQYDDRLIDNFKSEIKNLFALNTLPLAVICCSNEKAIPPELKRIFLKVFEIKAPNVQERESILAWVLRNNSVGTTFDLGVIANKMHGFLFEDITALANHAISEFRHDNKSSTADDIPETYFQDAVDFMQANYSESLGAPKVPSVKWSDIGGLNDVKQEIITTIELPLKHPDFLKNSGLKRSGILLYGPPGTGKTLIAKAVATECGLCFLSVKGPELLNMYVGQSEQNVREVFERAREASPCIIFFDELDSLAPNRGVSGDSGGVMDRVVSQLLAEMDGLNRSGTVFIIGATNRPDLIDPALLRPGRFDRLLYVGPCTDRASKMSVLEALTRKFNLLDDSVIANAADLCPANFSGADFYGVCSNAWLAAVRRLIQSVEDGKNPLHNSDVSLDDVIVTADDFSDAIKTITPSIKHEDLAYFRKLTSEFN